MRDPRTSKTALAVILAFIVTRIAARYGVELPPEVRDGIVFLLVAWGLHRAKDSDSPKPKPSGENMKSKIVTSMLLAAVVMLAGISVACTKSQLQIASGSIEVVAQEAQRSTGDMVRSGDMTPETADMVNSIFSELESSAHVFNLSLVNYESLTPRAKRELLQVAIDESVRILSRLEDQDIIKFKTERGRQKFNKWLSRIRIANSSLRVVQAALPPPQN